MSIIMDATNGITTANLTANTSISTPSIGSSTLTTPTISGLMTLTGGQIKFPATQVPSADANTLDDYEEGTWIATFNGVPQTRVGNYTKIGNLVFVIIYGWELDSTAVFATISGLPFVVRKQFTQFGTTYNTWTGSGASSGYFSEGGTTMQIVSNGTVTTATANAGYAKYIMASGAYLTD